jgi:hypothetical protein
MGNALQWRTESFLSDCWPQDVGHSQLITVCSTFVGKAAECISVGYVSPIVMIHGHLTKESRRGMNVLQGGN